LAIAFSTTLLKQVSALFQVGTLTGLADGALLERFRLGATEEAEAAFAALVDRHAPMVLRVCWRILGDRHDAEDAAQATFLVLARQARGIRREDSVASWLYGTAARIAGRARRGAARRRARERRGAEAAMAIRRVESLGDTGSEAWPELYEELGRLPDRFRLPVLLCHLEGLSYQQAARRLGCPVRTVQSRLARAREKLRARLIRRGVGADPAALSLSLAAAFRPDPSWSVTALSEAWKHATVTAAVRYAAGGSAAASVPAHVAALAKGASRAMLLYRLLKWAASVLLIGAATAEVVVVSSAPKGRGGEWRPDDTPLPKSPSARVPGGPDADTDGDGLSDFQEVHKYRTDPSKFSTAGDGVSDGDWQRRREFTYTIRTVVKVMPPVNVDCMNDGYQDARVLGKGANYVEVEVIHYPLNTNAEAIRSNPDWRRDAATMTEYLRPGITTNWDDAMRRDLVAALRTDGIDPDRLDDRNLVTRATAWLMDNSKFVNMFCTHYVYYPEGRAAIYPGLEQSFDHEKGDRAWTVQGQLDRELFGRTMYAHRTHGTCTSTAVFLTTALRALGIPTRMVLGIPTVDANDPAQLAMVSDGIHHHGVRRTLLHGLSGAQGYANHTFNEVYVGGRWVRLNDRKLGQNVLDEHLMGMLTHVNTFNDLSEVPLASTWGKRYALGERDEVFRYSNPYRCESVSDHFGRFAKVDNPEVKEHRTITISRAYWADSPGAPAEVRGFPGYQPGPEQGVFFIHGDEWIEGEPWQQYKVFMQAAGKEWLLRAEGHRDVLARITVGSVVGRELHELEVLIPPEEYARMVAGVEYTLIPRNEVPGYEWKTKGRVTLTKGH
jgi:RNA polymerase sigma factor (sigma-70 family)